MQKIFKYWLIVIIILAVIASFIVDIKSAFFGFLIVPTIIIACFILILGLFSTKKR